MALAALGLALPWPAAAQALWGAASLGDSPEAVSAAFPSAQAPAQPQANFRGEARLTASGQVFLGESYLATFFFKDGALIGVTLDSPSRGPFDPDEFKHSATIAPELARLYGGKPVCEDHSGVFALFGCDWTTNGLRIHFSYFEGAKLIEIGPADRSSSHAF